jgi:transcriptional regulator GlxA family with amidase domain
MSINEIAENHYISLRQLERRFKAKIGVTLKEFTSIKF